MRIFSFACILLLTLGLTKVSEGSLVITEIMVNPSGVKDDATINSDEWFEVFNTSNAVDMSTVKFDNDGNASDGVSLTGTLQKGHYAIFGNVTPGSFLATYGNLPAGAQYFQLPSPWNVLANSGGTVSLYSTLTNSTIFSMTYGATVDGRSLEYVGTTASGTSPYIFDSSHWQYGSTAHGDGNSGDLHSAGLGKVHATPEPAAYALMALATLALTITVRRQRRRSDVAA